MKIIGLPLIVVSLLLSFILLGMKDCQVQGDEPPKNPPIIGRRDLTVKAAAEVYPSWLEERRSGSQTLVGSFVGRFGSARPISPVEFENGEHRFSVPAQ